MRIICFALLTVLFSCNSGLEFNITQHTEDQDTLEVMQRYDSFFVQMDKDLKSRVDTTDLHSFFESLTDSSFASTWGAHLRTSTLRYLSDLISELNTPNIVKDYKKEVIHLTHASPDGGHIELEISADELLLSRNKGKIESLASAPDLWMRAKKECRCSPDDNLENIIMNSQAPGFFRIDTTVGGQYEFCWKTLHEGDVLSDLLNTKMSH